jgi:hypothetical protein
VSNEFESEVTRLKYLHAKKLLDEHHITQEEFDTTMNKIRSEWAESWAASKPESLVTERIFQRFLLAWNQGFSREELTELHADGILINAKLEHWPSDVLQGMVIGFRTWIIKGQHTNTETLSVEIPKTWFDHWKQDWASSTNPVRRWLVSKLKPPEYRCETKKVETKINVCPHYNSYVNENEDHFRFLTMDPSKVKSVPSDTERIQQAAMRIENEMRNSWCGNRISTVRILEELVKSVQQDMQ